LFKEKSKKEEDKMEKEFKIFDKYDLSEIQVKDPGLKDIINLKPKLILKSQGRFVEKFGVTKVNIVERLMNRPFGR